MAEGTQNMGAASRPENVFEPSNTARAPYFVVAGGLGSGKTTLARALASQLGWTYTPESRQAIHYLKDLFNEPNRWAFEAQVTFITEKANRVLDCVSRREAIVLDRSFDEDARVFAEYFRQSGYLDARSAAAYSSLFHLVTRVVPIPDAVLVCNCTPEIAFDRIASRGRPEDSSNSREFVESTYQLYAEWVKTAPYPLIFTLDSLVLDWRDSQVVRGIVNILSRYQTDTTDARSRGTDVEGLRFLPRDLTPLVIAELGRTCAGSR